MHGFDQGLDIVITLVLFQERLPSRRKYHEHLVRKMTQINVLWGSLRVNCAPSLRLGKPEWGSQPSQGQQKGIRRTSAIGLNVSITQLIFSTALSHVVDRLIGTISFMASLARSRTKRKSSVGGIPSRLCGIGVPV